jgi:hypothetical protein
MRVCVSERACGRACVCVCACVATEWKRALQQSSRPPDLSAQDLAKESASWCFLESRVKGCARGKFSYILQRREVLAFSMLPLELRYSSVEMRTEKVSGDNSGHLGASPMASTPVPCVPHRQA